jgi:hypothetical protein
MPEKPSVCAKCGTPLEQPATGRPRTYCGEGCRAAAAYELRRLDRRLAYLEGRLSGLRREPDSPYKDHRGRTRQEQIAAFEGEISDAEARLASLLTSANGIDKGVPR